MLRHPAAEFDYIAPKLTRNFRLCSLRRRGGFGAAGGECEAETRGSVS